MKLSELLSHTAQEYLDDRTNLLDGDSDELWSDKVITRYLNAAQERLCRRSWVLIDVGNPAAGIITLRTGKGSYPLHKSILRVYEATPEDTSIPLGRSTDERLSWSIPSAREPFEINTVFIEPTGRPSVFATDRASRTIRVYRTPSAEQDGLRLLLKVARMPSCKLTVTDKNAEPEIPDEWHLELCTYAAGRCLTSVSSDKGNRALGRELLDSFEKTVKEARQERERQEMAPERPEFSSTTANL